MLATFADDDTAWWYPSPHSTCYKDYLMQHGLPWIFASILYSPVKCAYTLRLALYFFVYVLIGIHWFWHVYSLPFKVPQYNHWSYLWECIREIYQIWIFPRATTMIANSTCYLLRKESDRMVQVSQNIVIDKTPLNRLIYW